MKKEQVQAILTATEQMVNEEMGTTDFNIELIHFTSTKGDETKWRTIIHFNEPDGTGLVVKNGEFDTSEESLENILVVALSCLVGTAKYGSVDSYQRAISETIKTK
jgi:hypothetical protein